MDEDKGERRGFQVKDRRRFSESGEARADVTEERPSEAGGARSDADAARGDATEAAFAREVSEPVTFATFVLGLSTQALFHLGEIRDPESQGVSRDLVAAKQVIDILGILKDKTRNNLEPGEHSLLESVLYDLRMRYVELVRRGTKEETA